MPAEETVLHAKEILTITDVTIIGVLLLVIVALCFVIWQLWKLNDRLNSEVKGFAEKYYVMSTDIRNILNDRRNV